MNVHGRLNVGMRSGTSIFSPIPNSPRFGQWNGRRPNLDLAAVYTRQGAD